MLPSTTRSPNLSYFLQISPPVFVHTSSVSHTCHMSHPSHYSGFNHPNNIWQAVQFMKRFLIQSLSVSCYLVSFRRKYFSLHPILEHPQPIFLLRCVSHPYASYKSNPSSVPLRIVDSYCALPWVTWEAVTVVEGIPRWGLLRHTLANGALVYPSQGRCRAEGCMALG
jgi:hypothetical protein